jgi:16S rRNA G966 N2-methylase RsmD
VAADALSRTGDKGEFDLLIADPPYGFTDWTGLLAGARTAFVVLESDRSPGAVAGWETVREKRYGRTVIAFLVPSP